MEKNFDLNAGNDGRAPDAPTVYPKKGAKDMGDSKEVSSKPMEMITAGANDSANGPTGSTRSYPKGSGVNMGLARRFNPMNDGMPTYGIGGVGSGEK